jgi:hypothetical protein
MAANTDKLSLCKVEGTVDAGRIKKQPVHIENGCENVIEISPV